MQPVPFGVNPFRVRLPSYLAAKVRRERRPVKFFLAWEHEWSLDRNPRCGVTAGVGDCCGGLEAEVHPKVVGAGPAATAHRYQGDALALGWELDHLGDDFPLAVQ